MLHTETIEGKTFQLLKDLYKEEQLKDFNLVGGTALALILGHRKSIDLDLFCPKGFDTAFMNLFLTDKYGFIPTFEAKNTLTGVIDGIKVDFITYPYKLLDNLIITDDIRLYNYKDICAMKLSAIVGNGTRLKDFVDIAYLSTKMSLLEMVDCYTSKYPNSSAIIPMKAVAYFADIDFSERIIMVDKEFDWSNVEKRITEMIRYPQRIFSNML